MMSLSMSEFLLSFSQILKAKVRIVFSGFASLQKLPSLFALLLIPYLNACAHRLEIHDLKNGGELEITKISSQAPEKGYIVLGENHYHQAIQQTQAEIIRSIVLAKGAQGRFSVGWEFLNYPDQKKVHRLTNQWKKGEINAETLMKELFPGTNNDQNKSYIPIMDVIKELRGELIAVNAPREWKKIILKQGLGGLTPEQVNGEIRAGSEGYFERFKKVMQGHVMETELRRYFEAQYYTDSIMANALKNQSAYDLRFLVVGSFHTDYMDGVVRELQHLAPDESVITIKLEDGRKLSADEINSIKNPHERYGAIADVLILIR
jgi:uncharacterized iron-regulated protein